MATKRGYYRAEIERAIDNLEMALTHLSRVVDAYGKDHEDISNMVLGVGNGLVQLAELLQQIHDSI